MSKRRAVILAVVTEHRTQAEVADSYGISPATVSRWVTRYRTDGDAAFEPRSRRPHTTPTATPASTVEAIIQLRHQLVDAGLDAGPETIRWHLEQHHDQVVSTSTIRRRLIDADLVTPHPRKRPRSSFTRFEAELPNETWQSDFTHTRLATGADTEIIVWLDDHSRYALHVTAHHRITGTVVVDTFTKTTAEQGFPASVLTDNGMVYTTRFAGGHGGRNGLETLLANLNIDQKHSRPNHPTTCGKVERFHQTLKKWLAAKPPAHNLVELQHLLDEFVDNYNHHRPHRALNRATPATTYNLLPKTSPTGTGAGPHHRLRHDTIDHTGKISLRRAGRMHHIGIGRAHTGQPVVLLIDDLDIRVIHTTTGKLLRHLTLDPTRDYQPQK